MNQGRDARVVDLARERFVGVDGYHALVSTQVLGLVAGLRERAGDELMGELTGAPPSVLDDWCEGWLPLPPEMEARLRLIDTLFATFDDHQVPDDVVTTWFATPNLSLGGRTPLWALRERAPRDIAPALLVGARAFID
ncbi:MAG TPA: hypothetical protein VFC33_17165 [Acidimicrobiia bacterium]|nr:hypothetical protein [Acidimicrobiia bacterium]